MIRFLKTFVRRWITPVGLTVLIAAQAAAVPLENPFRESREGSVIRVEGLEGSQLPESVPQGIRSPVSGLDIPGSVEEEEIYGKYHPEIPGESLSDPDDPTSGSSDRVIPGSEPERRAELAPGESGAQPGESGTPPGEEPQWGDDILILDGFPYRHADWDEDEATGNLYVIVDIDHFTADSNLIYRSTDGGENWTLWSQMVNYDGSINRAKIRVARDAEGQTWICGFGIWLEAGNVRNLWMGRKPAGGGAGRGAWSTTTYRRWMSMRMLGMAPVSMACE